MTPDDILIEYLMGYDALTAVWFVGRFADEAHFEAFCSVELTYRRTVYRRKPAQPVLS